MLNENVENVDNVQMYRGDPRTVAKARSRIMKRKLDDRLTYYEIIFSCKIAARGLTPEALGLENRSTYLPTIYLRGAHNDFRSVCTSP